MASGASPEAIFKGIVSDLVTRWRGASGVLFSTLGTLALHHPGFKQLYREIYAEFYRALEGPLRVMNPGMSIDEISLRVRLITALIDGSSMQIRVGGVTRYLARIQAEAVRIATA